MANRQTAIRPGSRRRQGIARHRQDIAKITIIAALVAV